MQNAVRWRGRGTAQARTVCRTKLSPSLHSFVRSRQTSDTYDVVLSSGFLAFANHSGFLQAVEEAGIHVSGVMGTSAGALAGSLYAAGYTPLEVAQHLRACPPIQLLRPCWEPWRGGLLSMDAVIERLAQLLPPTFEELERDFAVGVVTADGEHVLIDSGPLPEAVVASAAIPFVFSAVDVPGKYSGLKDGGVVDRIGLKAWRDRRRRQSLGGPLSPSAAAPPRAARPPPCLVHVIQRSSPFSGADDAAATGESEVLVVKSPKSGVNFFDLGEFDQHFEAARRRAAPALRQLTAQPQQQGGAAAAAAAGGPAPAAAATGGDAGPVVLVPTAAQRAAVARGTSPVMARKA